MSAAPEATDERATKTEARQRRLAGRVQGLRRRARSGTFDRWMLVVGGVLASLGVLIVVLGWAGASETHVVFEQIPYLISGGLLGVALVFAGAFVYFAYWLTLIVRDTRDLRRQLGIHQKELLAQQERIADTLADIRGLLSGVSADEPS